LMGERRDWPEVKIWGEAGEIAWSEYVAAGLLVLGSLGMCAEWVRSIERDVSRLWTEWKVGMRCWVTAPAPGVRVFLATNRKREGRQGRGGGLGKGEGGLTTSYFQSIHLTDFVVTEPCAK
jgi:hypothetical protein